MIRRMVTWVVALTVAAATLTAFAPPTEPAAAAVASDFDPGYIVSDENFYNGWAMTAPDVQNFLSSRNSSCSSSFACLFNYRQNTPSMAGTSYCQPMSGVGNESAASIIARVGNACGISQIALIVLLQKEQSLVTSSSPSRGAFESATGFGCPDTAPCDPSYGGFFYQVYNAARMFQVYRANPRSFNHQPNAWNNVLYHPNAACGRGAVFIRNSATAGLYNYTPYQPNAAALANLYGTGDGCSAYGNRNFWRIWTDWFGSPTAPIANLIRQAGTSTVFLASGGRRYPFTSSEMLAQYSSLGEVRDVSWAQLSAYAEGPAVQRTVKATDGSLFYIDRNRRFRTNCTQANDFGQACEGIPMLSGAQSALLADGGYLTSLVRLDDGSLWLMQGGARRETPDPSLLAPYGIPSNAVSLSNHSIGGNQIGAPVVGDKLYTDGAGRYRVLTPAGSFGLPTVVGNTVASGIRLHPYSFDRLPSGGSAPLRMESGGRAYVLAVNGWLEVDPALYGGTGLFTDLGTGATTAIPVLAKQSSPHFVRENSSSRTYLITGGYRQPVADQAEIDSISASFGVSKTVLILADGALTGVLELTVMSGVTTGRTPDGAMYLMDGGKHYRFTGCPQANDFGQLCSAIPSISSAQLATTANGGVLTSLVRMSDGSIWFMQSGLRRQTPDPTVLKAYGVPMGTTALTDATVTRARVGAPVLASGLFTNGSGAFRTATPGGNHDLSAAAIGMIGHTATRLAPESFALVASSGALPLRLFSDSRAFILTNGGWLEVAANTYGGTT
ncbi:hypothetical protein, partial [Agromyces sp. PvR057]|uniref:hypothetical protein n=1 Tax=Agromyces sp. PvR057 TaxID=3156403 RepID=UPI0013140391